MGCSYVFPGRCSLVFRLIISVGIAGVLGFADDGAVELRRFDRQFYGMQQRQDFFLLERQAVGVVPMFPRLLLRDLQPLGCFGQLR